jgi:hypothetical protein
MAEKEAPIIDDEDDEDLEFDVEFTTREEYFTSCATLIQIADMINPMTSEESILKKNILRRCYKIIDVMSAEMYDELFEDREEIES